jgi:CRP-like cAMP-binding protein
MIENYLLAALPGKDQAQLLTLLEPLELRFGDLLYAQGEVIEHVYFPGRALVSLLVTAHGHPPLEVGLIGPEGVVGLSAALGAVTSSIAALVQGTGSALRMPVVAFRHSLQRSPALQQGLQRYTEALMAQVSQTAACNRFHLTEERLARWLLMSSDRLALETFHMTHEFLGHMLGVRRVGVTEAAQSLQKRSLIRYHRGEVHIIDRQGLEAAACNCYAMIRAIDRRSAIALVRAEAI